MPQGVPWDHCVSCMRHVDECGPLSTRYKCARCGTDNALENIRQLREHAGPRFEHWRERCAAAFGVYLDNRRG